MSLTKMAPDGSVAGRRSRDIAGAKSIHKESPKRFRVSIQLSDQESDDRYESERRAGMYLAWSRPLPTFTFGFSPT